jgi:bud site selection protein 20
MGPKVGRKRKHHGIRDMSRKYRTRNYKKDLDQIQSDLQNPEKLDRSLDIDLPGLGQFYCIECR